MVDESIDDAFAMMSSPKIPPLREAFVASAIVAARS